MMSEPKDPIEPGDASLLLLREDVGENYEAVCRSAAAAVGADVCRLALWDAAAEALVAQRPRYTAVGQSVPQFPVQPSPASAHVLRTGEPYICNDPAGDPLYEPSVREHGVHSVLTVPVRSGTRTLGLLYALNKPGGFGPEDARTLTALAAAAAVTLENIRLYAEERQRRVLNEGLRDLSRALVSTATEDAALGTVLDQVWRVVRYQAAAALLLDGDHLRVAASRGGDVGLTVPLRSASEMEAALRSPEPAILRETGPLLPALGLRDVSGPTLVAPLRAEGQVVGAFLVVLDPEMEPSVREAQRVAALADHASLFLAAGAVMRRERQARARKGAVTRIARIAATRHEPDSLLQGVAPELLTLSGADRVILYLTHSHGSVLVPAAESGAAAGEQDAVFALGLDLTSKPLLPLLTRREPVRLQGRECLPLSPFPEVTGLLIMALAGRDDLLGAFALATVGRPPSFDTALMEVLGEVAIQVGMGVENARLFSRLSQMASTDELTQLANRRRFAESLRLEIGRGRRDEKPVSLVLVDIDQLKRVNDSHGHPAGDAAIRHVAVAIRSERRETDMAARLGGEEFALLLPGTPLAGAVRTAERIRAWLGVNEVPGLGTVTISAGVACFPEDAEDEEALVRVADERLYAAKAGGRNRVCAESSPTPSPLTKPSPQSTAT